MTSQASTEIEPRVALLQMINAYMISQALYVAAKLGIADLLKDGPKSCDELAASCRAHSASLYRVLRTLASVNVFSELGPGCFRLTPMAEVLRTDVPDSARGWAVFRGEKFLWHPWGELLYSVKSGKPAFNHVFGMEPFQYLEQNPEIASIYDDAMRSISAQKYQAVADAYDFSQVGMIVDVGGGNGGLLTAILNKHTKVKGVLAELPHVVESARKHIEAAGLADRCQCVSIDMLESVPVGGDAYIVANVIHDWGDEPSISILRNCRRGMLEIGRVLVVEMVVPPGNEPHLSKFIDLEMLVAHEGGKERSEVEYQQLFEKSGFRLTNVIPTKSPWSVVEGVAI
jgi:hypothetical protein